MRLNTRGEYPANWPEIATRCKDAVDWTCIRCGHPHCLKTGHVMTVHHLDGDKANCAWWNLLPLCQRCHLHIQAKVNPEQPWMLEHSEWFKPYVAGFYAYKYQDRRLTRDEVMAELDDLLRLEQRITGAEDEHRAMRSEHATEEGGDR